MAASSASARISTTDGSTQAFCPGHSATVQRKQGGKRQRRVDAEQGLVAVLADGIDERGVVERQRAVARGDVDHGRGFAVDPQGGESCLLPLAAAEVDPEHVDKAARFHALVSVRDPLSSVNL